MAVINVNPTRMELTRLKKQLVTAVRGHKLLKDKRDELMRQFLETVRETKTLRENFEEKISSLNSDFVNAFGMMENEVTDTALLLPKQEVYLKVNTRNIMSVDIPDFEISTRTSDKSDIFPYGFASTAFELDDAIEGRMILIPRSI